MGMDNVPRCRHVKVNGTQCGCPALRRRRYCYFHDRMLDGKKRFAENQVKPRPVFSMCLLEDANAVQVALMQVLQLLGSGQLDHKTAGLMLYGLQTASVNLRNTEFEAEKPTDVVIDRDDVHRTNLNGPQWFEEDFDGEEDGDDVENENEEDELEARAGAEDSTADVQLDAEAVPKKAAQSKMPQVSIEEARMKVEGAIRNWVLESVGEKIATESS